MLLMFDLAWCVVAELHGDAELRVLCGQLHGTVVVVVDKAIVGAVIISIVVVVDRSIERIVDSAIVGAVIISIVIVVDNCAFVVEQHTGGDVSQHACSERRRWWRRRHGRCVFLLAVAARLPADAADAFECIAGSGGPGQSTSTACTTTTTTCAAGGSSNYNSWSTTSLEFDSNGRTVSCGRCCWLSMRCWLHLSGR
jgi:hypothetical protein